MFEGDLEQGELEIGQVSALIDTIKPISEIINKLVDDFNKTISNLNSFQL
jgi:enoyl-[acyl-carrier protein] reductase II